MQLVLFFVCCLLLWESRSLPASIPLVKRMVDAFLADAVFLEPSDNLCEDSFVLPDVLGYLGMQDPARWAVPNDLNCLLGIIKLARTLGVNPHHRAPQQCTGNCSGGSPVVEDRSSSKEDSRSVEVCFKSILIRCSRCVIHHRECLNSVQL